MKLPLQITFRHMEHSPAVEERVRAMAQRLERFSSAIMSCRVVIEAPHQHQRQGQRYEVHVDLTIADGEVVAGKEHRERQSHEDVYVAIRDAFRAVRRQLEDLERIRRNDVKTHDESPTGRVSELNPLAGYGRIETSDGRTLYFHRNSVRTGQFEQLKLGAAVRFVEERGDAGPQATVVTILPHSAANA